MILKNLTATFGEGENEIVFEKITEITPAEPTASETNRNTLDQGDLVDRFTKGRVSPGDLSLTVEVGPDTLESVYTSLYDDDDQGDLNINFPLVGEWTSDAFISAVAPAFGGSESSDYGTIAINFKCSGMATFVKYTEPA